MNTEKEKDTKKSIEPRYYPGHQPPKPPFKNVGEGCHFGGQNQSHENGGLLNWMSENVGCVWD